MLDTPTIKQIAASAPSVYAFRILGEVTSEDMAAMADLMNDAFDAHDKVSMLLIFEHYKGSEMGASFSMENLKAQMRSIANVEKYAVVGVPDAAETMISAMDAISPVDARSFDMADEAAAWAFVGATKV